MKSRLLWIWLLLSIFLLYAPMQNAAAQKILLLTTNVAGDSAEGENTRAAFNNLQDEFLSQLSDPGDLTRLSVLGHANAISPATFSDAPGPYDMVIVISSSQPIHPSNWSQLHQAISNRWAKSMLFFVNSCCDGSSEANAEQMMDVLNASTSSSLERGNTFIGFDAFPLNTHSPYADAFAGLPHLQGGYFTYFNHVPAAHVLYVPRGPLPPAEVDVWNRVVGLLIPNAQSNAGRGACVFAVGDSALFYDLHWPDNQGKVAPAFLQAARSETGACGQPSIGNHFDKSSLSLGGGDNHAQLTITLVNGTPHTISGVDLVNALPSPLEVGAAGAVSSCSDSTLLAAEGASSISDQGFGIPAGGCSIQVSIRWPDTDLGRQACLATPTVTNTITPGTDFVAPTGQVNTPASASLNCQLGTVPAAKPEAVPMLQTIKLVLMGLSLVVLAVCAMRKRPGGDWPGH